MTMRSPLLLAALLLGSVLLAAAHPRLKDFANSADARAVAALLKALVSQRVKSSVDGTKRTPVGCVAAAPPFASDGSLDLS